MSYFLNKVLIDSIQNLLEIVLETDRRVWQGGHWPLIEWIMRSPLQKKTKHSVQVCKNCKYLTSQKQTISGSSRVRIFFKILKNLTKFKKKT